MITTVATTVTTTPQRDTIGVAPKPKLNKVIVHFWWWAAPALVHHEPATDYRDRAEIERFLTALKANYPGARVVAYYPKQVEVAYPTYSDGVKGEVIPYRVHYYS